MGEIGQDVSVCRNEALATFARRRAPPHPPRATWLLALTMTLLEFSCYSCFSRP